MNLMGLCESDAQTAGRFPRTRSRSVGRSAARVTMIIRSGAGLVRDIPFNPRGGLAT